MKNRVATLVLKLLIWSVLGAWLLFWAMRPTDSFQKKFWKPYFVKRTKTEAFGIGGSFMYAYSVPVIFLSLVGTLYLHLARRNRVKKSMIRKVSKYPVLVRGPLAVSSAAELFVLVLFVGLVVWTLGKYLQTQFGRKVQPWHDRMLFAGTKLGQTGIVCLAFLFFPVTRGSVFLQLFNIPFEHAVKYHIWIANIMNVIWTAHGVIFVILWNDTGHMKELITWHRDDISGLSGLITWIIGVVIWITSIAPVRMKAFELFYYTHQLYLLFILFFALHVGDRLYYAVLGGIFLFLVDRFARFLQSRSLVSVLSARMMSSETMEVVFAKDRDVEYNPASFLLVNFPTVSPLQWHPFTVTSSSVVDVDHISLLIKCYGGWTLKLREHIESMASSSHLEAAIEGPYGQRPDDYAMYDVLIFIAGGSGISPFISIIKEIMHKAQHDLKPTKPTEVILVWAVKRSEELSVLQLIDIKDGIKLDIQAYVTQEDGIDLEAMTSTKAAANQYTRSSPPSNKLKTSYIRSGMLHSIMVLASFAGLLFLTGLIGQYYINPNDNRTRPFPLSMRALLACLATALGIMSFGGASVFLWDVLRRKPSEADAKMESMETLPTVEGARPTLIHYGERPEFHDVFSGFAARFSASQAGVFACGPTRMQQDVAQECRYWKLDYHPLNYDL